MVTTNPTTAEPADRIIDVEGRAALADFPELVPGRTRQCRPTRPRAIVLASILRGEGLTVNQVAAEMNESYSWVVEATRKGRQLLAERAERLQAATALLPPPA